MTLELPRALVPRLRLGTRCGWLRHPYSLAHTRPLVCTDDPRSAEPPRRLAEAEPRHEIEIETGIGIGIGLLFRPRRLI